MTDVSSSNPRGDWARKYPPMLVLAVAVILALAVLPSSLNLPQQNPTQTLEFAPVPPDEEQDDATDEGNVSDLGLGASQSLEGDGALGGDGDGPGDPPPPPPNDNKGGRIDPEFRCVGDPPRQTEDPLAPPCVPLWDVEKDNGGATYRGVTKDEIRLLVALDGSIGYSNASDNSNDNAPVNQIYDLSETAEECRARRTSDNGQAGCTHLTVSGLRVWQQYFNSRFQTYGRTVRFFVSFTEGSGATAQRRRAEAADHLEKVQPFAVVSFLTLGAEDAYLQFMARKGVLNFGSFGLRGEDFYNAYPGMIWSYLPSIEQQAASYVSYVCEKVIGPDAANPRPASLAGGPLANQPRKLGILHTNNEKNHPGLVLMADLVKQKVAECGYQIQHEATYENCCLALDNGDSPTEEQQQLASFQSAGVTTILWTGGGNPNYARTAEGMAYQPEWILMGGDGFLDNSTFVFYSQSGPAFNGRAIAVSPRTMEPSLQQQRCFIFFREIDKNYPRSDLGYVCEYYTNLFQFFVGVQVAGPFIGPSQMNKGFHAIPQRYTGDPVVPACYYLPGDYTCVKDAAAFLWNQDKQVENASTNGCFVGIEGGRRYLAGTWPGGNIEAQFRPDDPCTGYSESVIVKYA